MLWYLILVFFFFQAEDGIRDLVRSRGLGDVYKRQGISFLILMDGETPRLAAMGADWPAAGEKALRQIAVSYTHLTLPTSDLV